MTNTFKSRIFLLIITIYALLKIITLATFIPITIRFSILAFLQGVFVLAIAGIQAYATYMVAKNREMVWIIFFALWSLITVVAIPIQVRKMIDYARSARGEQAPTQQSGAEFKEIKQIQSGNELE